MSGKERKNAMRIVDMIDSPNYNPETNRDRGDWSLRDVSTNQVFLNPFWNKPDCVEHGAMNCVSSDKSIWRCLTCARSAYDLDAQRK